MRALATGVVQAEEDEVLEAELTPDVSGDHGEVDSQNCGDGSISRCPQPCRAPRLGSSSGGF